jgi:outer membrane receptor protein involved in Fe transport
MLAGLVVRAGVENVADETPPLLATRLRPTPTIASTTCGRRFYFSASYKF